MGLLLNDLAADTAAFLARQAAADPHGNETHGSEAHRNEAGGASGTTYCASTACKRNWRIVFALVLFLEGLVFGYVALFLRRFACISTRRFRKFLHFVNVGGGGIFLATGLLHILPEAVELLSGEAHAEPGHAEPGHAAEPGHTEAAKADPHAGHEVKFPTAFAIILGAYFVFLFFDRVLFSHADGEEKPIIDPLAGDEDQSEDAENALQESLSEEPVRMNGFSSSKFFSASIMVIGIAAHSLFESIVLGSSTQFSTILNTFIAIAAHRWSTSMALGSRFAKDNLAVGPYSVLMVLFALIAPLGILIGVGVRGQSEVFQGVIFALSAGTFIYIGAFETTAEEFVAHDKWLFSKFFVMLSGAALMLIITGVLVAERLH